jgi:hypothetical protein
VPPPPHYLETQRRGPVGGFPQQPGLADTRFTGDQDRAVGTLPGGEQRRLNRLQFRGSAHQGLTVSSR